MLVILHQITAVPNQLSNVAVRSVVTIVTYAKRSRLVLKLLEVAALPFEVRCRRSFHVPR